jgi:hypothetical protein
MSRSAWYSTTGAIVSPKACDLQLNEQTTTPNAGCQPHLEAEAKRKL